MSRPTARAVGLAAALVAFGWLTACNRSGAPTIYQGPAGAGRPRFTVVAAEYAKAPQVTGRRLYIEALEQILPKIRKMIVDPQGNLDLSIIRKGEPRNP